MTALTATVGLWPARRHTERGRRATCCPPSVPRCAPPPLFSSACLCVPTAPTPSYVCADFIHRARPRTVRLAARPGDRPARGVTRETRRASRRALTHLASRSQICHGTSHGALAPFSMRISRTPCLFRRICPSRPAPTTNMCTLGASLQIFIGLRMCRGRPSRRWMFLSKRSRSRRGRRTRSAAVRCPRGRRCPKCPK